jgi:hypothetical protein
MDITAVQGGYEPFTCIKDIVINGLSPDRFAEGEHKPTRNEITIFLAAWCKHRGFTPDIYGDWLIDFTVDVLSRISSSKPSAIRHSTKSIIKYVHRRNVDFSCKCRNNDFKAVCSSDCPIYEKMEEIYLRDIEIEQKRIEELSQKSVANDPVPDIDPEPLLVTKRYKKQLEEAVILIKKYLNEGRSIKEILAMLNQKGYRTITGRAWKQNNLSLFISTHGLSSNPEK